MPRATHLTAVRWLITWQICKQTRDNSLVWDLRPLGAAGWLNCAAAKGHYPSLYLKLGGRKLGDWKAAREHSARATESPPHYRRMATAK